MIIFARNEDVQYFYDTHAPNVYLIVVQSLYFNKQFSVVQSLYFNK